MPAALYDRRMETFSIEAGEHGGFAVTVTTPDDPLGHIVISFPTWRQARDWVAERTWTGHPATLSDTGR
jgi:hypothetical protein